MSRPVVQRYRKWKDSTLPGGFNLEVTSAFGSGIGVRFGRYWSFYLQENVYTQHVSLLKKKQVTVHKNDYTGDTYYKAKSGGLFVVPKTVKEPVTFRGKKLMDRSVTYYVKRTNQACAPVRVGEIYPTRTFSVDFNGKINIK